MKYLFKILLIIIISQSAFAKDDFFEDDASIEEIVKKDEIFYDPIEPFNRKSFFLFKFATEWVLLPVAKTYDYTTPDFLQTHIAGVFGNIGNIPNSVSGIFVPHKIITIKYISTFLSNAIFGLGGFFDVSSEYQKGVPSFTVEDIAQYYFKKPLPYFVLPMGFGNVFNIGSWFQRTTLMNSVFSQNNGFYIIGGILVGVNQGRVQIEDTFKNSLDSYSIIRNVYYQAQTGKLQYLKYTIERPAKYSSLISSEFD